MTQALVLIDLQNGLLDGSPGSVAGVDALLARVRAVLDRARAAGVPVIYVQDDDVGAVGSAAWAVHERIAPRAGEPAVRKTACDAFHETELDALLRARGVDHLVVAGVKTPYCIDSTLRRAVTLGYGVTLVRDGHGTSDGPTLPAAAIIAHHEHVLNGFGAYVGGKPCEIVLGEPSF